MKNQNEVIDDLIETLKDGQEGFKQAAESVKNPQLKSLTAIAVTVKKAPNENPM